MADKLRELVEQQLFAKNKAKIQPDAKRMDEALRGLGFVLARCPEKGSRSYNKNIWAIATDALPGSTSLVVFYSFDDNRVFLEDIAIAEAQES